MKSLPEDRGDRAAASDPRLNVALEASAGTGKTRVLVDRYIRLVQEGADPRHILAITFTRKAAGEMKGRIIDTLRKDEALWRRMRERLFDIHVATIDAFCLGLLKEFPLEAGLDPDLDLLDEVDIEQLTQEAIDYVLSASSPGPGLTFLISVYGERALENAVRGFIRSRLVKEDTLARYVNRAVPHHLRLEQSLASAAKGLADVLGGRPGLDDLTACGPDPSHPLWKSLVYALERAVDPSRAGALDIEHVAEYFITQEGEPRKRLTLFVKNDFRTERDYVKHRDLVLARAPDVAEMHRRWSDDRDRIAVRELWKCFHSAAKRFSALKEARHGLDFTDVLLEAVDLLEHREEFSQSRFRLESRYHHILIDEAQDTNDFQWRLVEALIESWGEGAGLVQEVIRAEQAAGRGRGLLQEPTIFVVGDRKQSIYGWRDARVETFEKAARYIRGLRPAGGRRLHLRRSFRAKGELLAFLNDVFFEIPKAREELEWTFRYGEGDRFPVGDRRDDERPVGVVVAPHLLDAANAVADEVVRLIQEEHFQPGDMAILFRSRTHYRVYEEALAERGVPTYVYRGLGFFDSPEVRDIQSLVRYLAEPGSELRAAELARSRFIRISDTGLALIARMRRRRECEAPLVEWLRGELTEDELPPTLSPSDRATAIRAMKAVPGWLHKVDRLPPADLIQLVLEETDYAAWFWDPKVRRQGWENLKKVQELIRRAQNRGYLTFSRLADYMDRASTGEESLAVLEAADGVNLMTIHAAKGLEFDVVFVVNLDQTTRGDTSLPRITEHADGSVDVHALARPEFEGPDRSQEEEKRLLYVALTRARAQLILCASAPAESEGKVTLFGLLPESLRSAMRDALSTDRPELEWCPGNSKHSIRVVTPAPEPREYRRVEEKPEYRLHLEPLPDSSLRRLTVGALVRERMGEEPNPWAFDPIDLAVGATVHRMFEYKVPLDAPLLDVASALSPDLSGRTLSERRKAMEKAADLYERLGRNLELERLMKEGEVHREVPFAVKLGNRVVRGVIDSLVLLPEGVVVIDYKTGAPRPEHKMQMELYLEAARGLFPDRHAEGMIFYPQSSQPELFSQRKW
jgi:ATP-dependent helicase/nuclease subunit A